MFIFIPPRFLFPLFLVSSRLLCALLPFSFLIFFYPLETPLLVHLIFRPVCTHIHTETTAILTRWFFVLSSFLSLSSNIVFYFRFYLTISVLAIRGLSAHFRDFVPTLVIIKLMAINFWLAECSQWLSGEKVSLSFGILSFLFGWPLSSDGRNGQRSPLPLSLRFALKLPTRKNRLPSRSWLYFSTTNRTFFFTLQGNQITATPISYISVIISCVYWNKT